MLDILHNVPLEAAGLLCLCLIIAGQFYNHIDLTKNGPPTTEKERIFGFKLTVFLLILLASICLIGWILDDRPLSAMTVADKAFSSVFAAWAISLGISAFTLFQLYQVQNSEEKQAEFRKMLGETKGMENFQINSPQGARWFDITSLTAGICEEIVFRAFAITLLALYMPLWAAAIFSAVIFITSHAYQGVAGMLRITPITIALTAVWLLSGSILPCIILHTIVDLTSGRMLRVALKPAAQNT